MMALTHTFGCRLLAVHALLSAACVDMNEAAAGPLNTATSHTPTPNSTPTPTSTSTTPRKKGDKKAHKGAANNALQQV